MHNNDEGASDEIYRTIIDALAHACRDGQGQVGPRRVRGGVWNRNATADEFPEQHEINELLGRLSAADRETVARMLNDAFRGGVHTALVTLHEENLAPFDKAYEGTPFHDFMGAWTAGIGPR
jgi:hypothetical protein